MKILFNKEAREKIKKGIDKCCDVARVSLGHNGKNVLISNGQVVDIINDGVTIVKFVDSKDEVELAGIRLAQQCAGITDQTAGDGTTTTLVLLQAFLKELISDEQLEQPRLLRKKVLDSVEKVIKNLEKNSKKVKKEDIEHLATTASLSSEIGKMVSDIFNELGEEANITLEETRHNVIDKKIVNGYQFSSVNKNLYQEDTEIWKDVPVVVYDKKVNSGDILSHIRLLLKDGENTLLVIAPQIAKDLIGLSTKFNAKGEFKIGLVQDREPNIEDLKSIGNKVKKAIITKETTTLIGGNGDAKKHIVALKEKLDKEESTFQREILEKRIASLSSGIAVITVGAVTDVEREEKKLKIEDAIRGTKTALKYGYVKGGGIGLIEASEGEWIEKVCAKVYDQICENSEGAVKVSDNVKDSLLTVKSSLRSAASIATSLLTAEAILVEENE